MPHSNEEERYMISALKYEGNDYKMCSNWGHDAIRDLLAAQDDDDKIVWLVGCGEGFGHVLYKKIMVSGGVFGSLNPHDLHIY